MISTFFPAKFLAIFGLILVQSEGRFSSDAFVFNPPTMTYPQLCSVAARWTHNGRDLVRDYQSRVLLVSFFPKLCGAALHKGYEQNRKCDEFFQRYEEMAESIDSDVRILIVAHNNESSEILRNLTTKFKRIRFEQEVLHQSPIWSWFKANEFDHFIFDRCSRLANRIDFTASNDDFASSRYGFYLSDRVATHFDITFKALKSASHYANCGWCQYDATRRSSEANTLDIYNLQRESAKWPRIPFPEVHPTRLTISLRSRSEEFGPQARQTYEPSITMEFRVAPVIADKREKQHVHTESMLPSSQYLVGPTQRRFLQQYAKSSSAAVPYYDHRPSNNNLQPFTHKQSYPLNAVMQQQRQQPSNDHYQQTQRAYQHENLQGYVSEQERRQHYQQQQRQRELDLHRFQMTTAVPATTTIPPVQYASLDPYAGRYQYRLDTGGHRRTLAQRDEERRLQEVDRYRHERRRQEQLDELRAERQRQQQYMTQQQLALEQQQRETVAAAAALRRNSVTGAHVDGGDGKKSDGAEPAPLYPEGSETFDYYEDDAEWTTIAPEVQIPTPTTKLTPIWPSIYGKENVDYGFNLPCDGYTDEICYQQQAQLKPNEVHRCCKNRVLFTDQCLTGKCTNVTQQLCCIQKFLQAKLSCCLDESQLEMSEPGDHFSRCCFNNFVTEEEDPCCPTKYAKAQWRGVHELCLPNVEMDLSRVKVPTMLTGTTLTTEFDFSKTNKWHFDCKYGAHIPQFSYFVSDENAEKPTIGGGQKNIGFSGH